MSICNIKAYVIICRYPAAVILRCGTLKSTLIAMILAELPVLIEIVFKFRTAETAIPSLACFVEVKSEIFGDTVVQSIFMIFPERSGERIVTVENKRCFGGFIESLLYVCDRCVDLAVSVHLVTEQIGNNDLIRFKIIQYDPCVSFVHFKAGIIRFDFTG